MVLTKSASALVSCILVACLGFTGCGSNAPYTNQLNAFDGDAYSSLTVAHAALLTMRAQVVASYSKYTDEFNLAATSYNTALTAYTTFRQAPEANQAQVAAAIANLTVSVVALENAIQADLHVSQAQINKVRAKAAKIRAHAASANNLNLANILTALQIAASVAAVIPGASPYAALAEVVISATSQAVAALQAQSGKTIDLSLISAVPAIGK